MRQETFAVTSARVKRTTSNSVLVEWWVGINLYLRTASAHVLATITTRDVRSPGNPSRPSRFVGLGLKGYEGL